MDRAAGPEDGGIALAAVFPSVVGTYAGTANVVATTTFGLRETLSCPIQDTGAVRVLADAEGGGANIFEDASARSGCALVSSSGTLNGKVADTLLNVLGTAAFDCPSSFGTIRVNASANVTANRIQQVTAQLLRE
jgi:FlaG/FlaF family flagellin (archaellin)